MMVLQALHQAALDQGEWTNAQLLIPTADPLGRPEFGAGEQAMVDIAKYRRALRDLKKQHSAKADKEDEDNGEHGGDDFKKGGGKKKKRGGL